MASIFFVKNEKGLIHKQMISSRFVINITVLTSIYKQYIVDELQIIAQVRKGSIVQGSSFLCFCVLLYLTVIFKVNECY